MSDFATSEKRQFVRVPVDVEVKYRFIQPRSTGAPTEETTYSGKTGNIGAGGLLLVADLPEADLIADLLMGKIIVGLELYLPDHAPIQALSRVAWLESVDEEKGTCAIGLSFKEITAADQDKLFRFVITSRMG